MQANKMIYQSHPSFSFKGKKLSIDIDMLNEFEKSYKDYVLDSSGSNLQETRKKIIVQDLSNKVEKLFKNLIEQSNRENQKHFLEEISENIKRILKYEFSLSGPDYSKKIAEKNISDVNQKDYFRNKYYISKFNTMEKICLEIMAFFALVRPKINVKRGNLKREDLSKNAGLIIFLIKKYLNFLFKKNGTLGLLSEIYGRRIAVTGLAVELSVPSSDWWKDKIGASSRPPHTLYCHIDESNRYPKSIVYLSKVTRDNGPFSVYPGVLEVLKPTHLGNLTGKVIGKIGRKKSSKLFKYFSKSYHQSMNSENFRKEFSMLPSEIQFNSHFGWDVMPETEIEEFISSKEVIMEGESGTFCIFNGGELLHRGGLANTGKRVALQVIFG